MKKRVLETNLRDIVEESNKLNVNIEISTETIEIIPEELSNPKPIIRIEYFKGDLRVLIWKDESDFEPSNIISTGDLK